MVETSLFPRPNFTSFLQSDDNVDPLSYYQYQRLQRLQKVARLQERRSKSYEPGYKKPLVLVQPSTVHAKPHVTSTTRQIFTKPNLRKSDTVTSTKHLTIPPLKRADPLQVAFVSDEVEKQDNRFSVPIIPGSQQVQIEKDEESRKDHKYEQLSSAVRRKHSRPVKSATVQSKVQSWNKKLL